jgi:pectinesterase
MLLHICICLLVVGLSSGMTPPRPGDIASHTATAIPREEKKPPPPKSANKGRHEVDFIINSGKPMARSLQEDEEEVQQSIQTVLVVSADGHPDHFPTVQAAVDAVPMWNYLRWIIYIKSGTYVGTVFIPEGKDYITLLGEGADSTILTFNRKACDKRPDGTKFTILDCPSVIVEASYFTAKDITFENSSPKPADLDYDSQAPAIRISGDNCAFYNCNFLGWQDTLYADQGKHYYVGCHIEGNVDFILGYARAVFESCTIYSRGEGFITAQSRWCKDDCPGTADSAFVILRSNVTGYRLAEYNSTGTGLTYLGRPWREFAKVVFIDTTMGEHIAPEGWVDWLTDTGPLFSHDSVYFAEFGSTGPGANASARVDWSHQLSDEEAEAYRDVTGFLEADTWLEAPPSLEDLMKANLLQDESWGRAVALEGHNSKKFPPRRWKNLSAKDQTTP